MYQPIAPKDKKNLPTMYDLPSEYVGDPGLPDEFHYYQAQLLNQTCHPPSYPPEQVFSAIDINLYYDQDHLLWYKRPDWFVVVGHTHLYQGRDLRQSYVIWDEEVSPFLVVELLSEGTEDEDLGLTVRKRGKPPTKWQVYEQILQVPYYVTFDERNLEFRKFRLIQGKYQEFNRKEATFWLEELQLGLGIWHGYYEKAETDWLRWYNAQGVWLPTPEEKAQQAQQRAEQAQQRAEQAQQRAEAEYQRAQQELEKVERLKAQLRALGHEPEDL